MGATMSECQPASWGDTTAKLQGRLLCEENGEARAKRRVVGEATLQLCSTSHWWLSLSMEFPALGTRTLFPLPLSSIPSSTGTGLTCELCDLNNKWNGLLSQIRPLTGLKRINRNEGIWSLSWGVSEDVMLGELELWWDIVRDLVRAHARAYRNPRGWSGGHCVHGSKKRLPEGIEEQREGTAQMPKTSFPTWELGESRPYHICLRKLRKPHFTLQ